MVMRRTILHIGFLGSAYCLIGCDAIQPMPPLMTSEEVAAVLRCEVATVARYVHRRVVGRHLSVVRKRPMALKSSR